MNYTKSSKSLKNEQEINRDKLVYKTNDKKKMRHLIFNFQDVKTLRSFDRYIISDNITLNDAQGEHIKLKYTIDNFSISTGRKTQNKNDEKDLTLMNVHELLRGRQISINVYKSRIFQIKNINIDDNYYFYDDEVDSPKSPVTLSVVLEASTLTK